MIYRFSYEEPYFERQFKRGYCTEVRLSETLYSFLAENDDEAREKAARFIERKNKELPAFIALHQAEHGEPYIVVGWSRFKFSPGVLSKVIVPAVAETSVQVALVPGFSTT